MENKFYTPKIEEFHVGFEYEKKEIVSKGSFLEEDWVDKKCVCLSLQAIGQQIIGLVCAFMLISYLSFFFGSNRDTNKNKRQRYLAMGLCASGRYRLSYFTLFYAESRIRPSQYAARTGTTQRSHFVL